MARIRTIKPDFWTHEKVLACKPLTRLLFIGMWNFADDYGRLSFSPSTFKAQIFPIDNISVPDVKDMLTELSSAGLLLIYTVDDREFIEITGWHHQKIDRRQAAKCPAPFVEDSSNSRREIAPDLTLSNRNSTEQEVRVVVETKSKEGDLRQAIVRTFEQANSPNLPETSRAGLWLAQGYEPEIILAVIAEGIRRKPSVGSLNYFDKPIEAAHQAKNPKRLDVIGDAAVKQAAARLAAKVHVKAETEPWFAWSKHLGKPPPIDKDFGWYLDSEWPPGCELQKLAS